MQEMDRAGAHVDVAPERGLDSRAAPPWSWLWIVTAGAGALVLAAVLLAGLWFLLRPLAILFLGVTIAAALTPVVNWLDRWLPRNVGTVLVFLLLALLLTGFGWLVVPPLIDQAGEMIDRIPELADRAEAWLRERVPLPAEVPFETILSQITGVASALVALPLEFSSALLDLFLVAFIALYALIAAPNAHRFLGSLMPARHHQRANEVVGRVFHAMGGYVRGATITGLIIGTLTYVGLLLIGVNFALVLAIIAGVLEYIPFIGPFIAGALIVIIAFLQSPTKALIALVFAIALQQVEGNIVSPNIMHPQTNVSRLTTIFSIFAGWSLGGVLGALIAIPIAAALRVLIMELVAPAIRRQTGAPPVKDTDD